jgi:hypothetical protein
MLVMMPVVIITSVKTVSTRFGRGAASLATVVTLRTGPACTILTAMPPVVRYVARIGAGLLLSGCAAVLLSGCATNAAFVAHQLDEVEGALTEAGLTVCSVDETDNELPGGVGGVAIEVAAGPCPSEVGADDPEGGTVLVEEFESADDRDGHVRDVYLHGRLRPFTTATPFGRYTVRLAGGSDGEVVARYDRAVDLLDEQA